MDEILKTWSGLAANTVKQLLDTSDPIPKRILEHEGREVIIPVILSRIFLCEECNIWMPSECKEDGYDDICFDCLDGEFHLHD